MNLDAPRAAFRRELGLPDRGDGRIVMTGHQCSLWHAGILAKYLACGRMVPADFDHAAWLWVDQDTDETHTARVPVRTHGVLSASAWALKPAPGADIPGASMPAFNPAPFDAEPALPQVQAGIERTTQALSRHVEKPNAARQFAAALTDLMSPLVPAAPAVFATDFIRTALGAALLHLMAADPGACAKAYNCAVAAHPDANTAALHSDGGDTELPLWRLTCGKPRERVHASTLAHTDPSTLAPRALLMTGMARLAACDLFVHGTGGGGVRGYDTITEAWFRDWLGLPLAPTIVVTADLRLPLHTRDVSHRDVAYARWRAHHARHDPAFLHDPAAAARKAELLGAVRAAKSSCTDPKPHYAEMHGLLESVRQRHATELAGLRREADETEALFREGNIAADRTWAFVFHEPAALRAMSMRVNPAPQT